MSRNQELVPQASEPLGAPNINMFLLDEQRRYKKKSLPGKCITQKRKVWLDCLKLQRLPPGTT